MVRFRGTLRSVEPLGTTDTTVSLVGWDHQRFAVKIAVESVEPNPQIQPGTILSLAIHSPAQSFGAAAAAAGTTLDLELVSEACDGTFWRFMELRPRSPAGPQPFQGFLEAGMIFRVPVEWDPEKKATVFSEDLHLPNHYGGGIEWINPAAVQQLSPEHPRGLWVLEVRAEDSEHLGDNRYRATYKCVFLSLEPCRPCTAAD